MEEQTKTKARELLPEEVQRSLKWVLNQSDPSEAATHAKVLAEYIQNLANAALALKALSEAFGDGKEVSR